jgi:hypothetical protein
MAGPRSLHGTALAKAHTVPESPAFEDEAVPESLNRKPGALDRTGSKVLREQAAEMFAANFNGGLVSLDDGTHDPTRAVLLGDQDVL